MSRRYYGLQEFFLGYFHPDWQLDSATRADVVNELLNSADSDSAQRILEELTDLLAEPLTEKELHEKIIGEYSLFYDPWRNNESMRGWLEGLLYELRRDQVP